MRKGIPMAVITAIASLTMAAPAMATGGSTSGISIEQFKLDFYEAGTVTQPLGDGAAGPVSTSKVIPNGKVAIVAVRGTVSAFNAVQWTAPPGIHLCGTPEPAPIFQSPGTTNGAVGTDAEFNFARPFPNSTFCPPAFPRHHTLFQMDFGDGFAHYEPIGGQPTAVSNTWFGPHVYFYAVMGQGQKARFQELDGNTVDNYGQYRITVLTLGGCKSGGWLITGKFKSEKECTSFLSLKNPPVSAFGPSDPEDLEELAM